MSAPMRIGLLGGTFDPIHHGHLLIAEEARVSHRLDRVLFIPNGVPAHKNAAQVTSPQHRYAMASLATAPNAAFECSRIEVDRPGKSYTVDTLHAVLNQFPGSDLYFIIGMDTVGEIVTWRRHEEILTLCTFLAAERPGYSLEALLPLLSPQLAAKVLPVPSSPLDISGTDIRRRVLEGRPIRYLIPDPVVQYIEAHRLYR